jgi:hypothetical protein
MVNFINGEPGEPIFQSYIINGEPEEPIFQSYIQEISEDILECITEELIWSWERTPFWAQDIWKRDLLRAEWERRGYPERYGKIEAEALHHAESIRGCLRS